MSNKKSFSYFLNSIFTCFFSSGIKIHIFIFTIPWIFFGFKFNKGSNSLDLAWFFYIYAAVKVQIFPDFYISAAVWTVKLRFLNQTKIWIILVLRNLLERNLSLFSRKRFQSSTAGMKLCELFVSLRCRSTVASGSLRWQQPMLRRCR